MAQNENVKKILNDQTDWSLVSEDINNGIFEKNYPNYYLEETEKGYIIQQKNDPSKFFFVFKIKRKISIYFGEKVQQIQIYSSSQIDDFIKENNIDNTKIYIKNTDIKYSDVKYYLDLYLDNNELEIKKKKELPNIKFDKPLSDDKKYKPEEYSKYFYDYFIYEDENKKGQIFNFQNNDIRRKIINNILKLRNDKNLKTFKLTGPTSIGKSITLFHAAHTSFNVAYINMKCLINNKNDLFKTYSMIISELERFKITEPNDFMQLINENYYNDKTGLQLLLKIMEFLNNSLIKTKKLKSYLFDYVFILDQFKLKYIEEGFNEIGFLEKISSLNYIKLVECSSINDKNMREECIKTWQMKGKNILDLTIDNQKYFFYFTNIYKNIVNKDKEDKILKQFRYLPKYIHKFKKYNNYHQFYEDIREHIDKKIDEFCKAYKMDKSYLLTNLKYLINKEHAYDKFNSVIEYCPLKYFIIVFTIYSFKIRPIFPFILNIINYKLNEDDCDKYFRNVIYKTNTIENQYVKGDYFEAAVKYALQKILPKKKDDDDKYKIVKLNEIVSMDKIITDKDDIIDYEDDEPEENNNKEDKSTINIGPEKNIIKQENKNYEEEEEEIESEEKENDSEENIKIGNEKEFENYIKECNQIENANCPNNTNQIKDNNIIKQESGNLETLLSKFNIEIKDENSKFLYYSKESKQNCQNIEDYRMEEIKQQKNEKLEKDECIFKGDESFFLTQNWKWGKTLDFGYMYGDKFDKIFIGFQVKCYF